MPSKKLLTTLDKWVFWWYITIMTKKDFEFVAALISAVRDFNDRQTLAVLAGAKFAKDNPRFDVDRFNAACRILDQQPWKEARISNPDALALQAAVQIEWAEEIA
jgi:hypothetical protein